MIGVGAEGWYGGVRNGGKDSNDRQPEEAAGASVNEYRKRK